MKLKIVCAYLEIDKNLTLTAYLASKHGLSTTFPATTYPFTQRPPPIIYFHPNFLLCIAPSHLQKRRRNSQTKFKLISSPSSHNSTPPSHVFLYFIDDAPIFNNYFRQCHRAFFARIYIFCNSLYQLISDEECFDLCKNGFRALRIWSLWVIKRRMDVLRIMRS